MKAFTIFVLLAALLIVGCGEKEQSKEQPKEEPKSQATPEPKPEPEPEPKEEPAPEPKEEAAPEPEPKEEPAPEPKEKSLSEREVDRLLEEAVPGGQALELRDDGNYYEKDQQTAYTGWVKQVTSEGRVQSLEQLQDGKKNGLSLRWHQNGQRSLEGNFSDNKSDGAWIGWHENGEKAGERNYREGVLHGPFAQSWPNGQSMMEGNYSAGNQEGVWVRWHENGQKQQEITYRGGEIIIANYWNSSGNVVGSLPDGRPAGPLR